MPANQQLEPVKEAYDLEYITRSLELVLLPGDGTAINVSAIASLDRDEEEEAWRITLNDGEEFLLSDAEMAQWEAILKAREAALRSRSKELYKQSLKAQAEAVAELNNSIAPAMIVGGPDKRFKN